MLVNTRPGVVVVQIAIAIYYLLPTHRYSITFS